MRMDVPVEPDSVGSAVQGSDATPGWWSPATIALRWREFAEAMREARVDRVPWRARWQHLRGLRHQTAGDYAQAVACYEAGLRIAPNARGLSFSLAYALHLARRHLEASRLLLALLRRDEVPRARALLALVVGEMGMVDEAERHARAACAAAVRDAFPVQALVRALSWQLRYREAVAAIEHYLATVKPNRVLASWLAYNITLQPDAGVAEVERASALVARSLFPEASRTPAVLRHRRGERIRVGYVSADLRRHPVGEALEPVLAHHDRAQFDVHVFDGTGRPDATSTRLQRTGLAWHRIAGLADATVVRMIRRAGVDILVDLSGHTRGERLAMFAQRPAARQLSWLGFPNTTALPCMDWRVVDAYTVPEGAAFPGTERPLRLPRVFAAFVPRGDAPTDAGRCDPRGPVFCGVHKFEKLNDAVIACWAALLDAVPESRLVLARDEFDPLVARWIVGAFRSPGVDPRRVEVRRLGPGGGDVDAVFDEIDVLLDAFPWSGHVTCCHALARGVPVITLAGEFHAGRMVASVLTVTGYNDMVAMGVDDYVRRGARFAAERDQLRAARPARARTFRASVVCDGAAFTRDLEQAYRRVVETA
jgi:predicted O-linked N-acetylglucosamine transferase (SPINDLY family)